MIVVVFICLWYFYSNNYVGVFEILMVNLIIENVVIVLNDLNGFFVVMMINIGKLFFLLVCVVDLVIIECLGMGFGVFFFFILD